MVSLCGNMFLDLSKKPQKKVPQMLESRKNVRIFVQFFFFFFFFFFFERERERERDGKRWVGYALKHLQT